MYYFRIKLQYDGTDFAGFQWQKGPATIQEELNRALSDIQSGKITTMGASRTDSGVHAHDQMVKITSENPLSVKTLPQDLNRRLPKTIRCLSAEACDGLFHPAKHAKLKEYRYLFTNTGRVSERTRRFVANMPRPLRLELMHQCTEAFVGEHDFVNFFSTGSNVTSTVRTVSRCELTEVNPQELFFNQDLFSLPAELERCYQLRIEADGFLKQMIRHLIAALWMVGTEKLTVEEFVNLLDGPRNPKQQWKIATARGLHLYRVTY